MVFDIGCEGLSSSIECVFTNNLSWFIGCNSPTQVSTDSGLLLPMYAIYAQWASLISSLALAWRINEVVAVCGMISLTWILTPKLVSNDLSRRFPNRYDDLCRAHKTPPLTWWSYHCARGLDFSVLSRRGTIHTRILPHSGRVRAINLCRYRLYPCI